jgi:Fe-Mn family superoxide dismutase
MADYEVLPLPYSYDALEGISKRTLQLHHDHHYAGHVKGRSQVEERLQQMRASGNYSGLREAMLSQAFHGSGQMLHELYYAVLGGDGTYDDKLAVIQRIGEDFGSFDGWKQEFIELGKVARGWAILCHDAGDGRLHNALADSHEQPACWGFRPLLPLDVSERAYYLDQEADRGPYIEAFFRSLNWKRIDELYAEARGGNGEGGGLFRGRLGGKA